MSSTSDISITASSGNVFADLGIAEPEQALAKAQLAYAISKIVARKRLSQAQAAALLGIDQPKVSALVRGHLTGFSIERLFRFLQALNQELEIVIRPAARTHETGRINVVTMSRGRVATERQRSGTQSNGSNGQRPAQQKSHATTIA